MTAIPVVATATNTSGLTATSSAVINVSSPASVQWATIPHILNDWSVAGQVTFGGKKWYVESSRKPYAAQLSTNTTSPIFRGEVRNNELWTDTDGGNDTERAELDGSPNQYAKGTEFWFAYQFLVEPGAAQISGTVQPNTAGNPGDPLEWGYVGQIHSSGNQAAVPWELGIKNENITVETQRGNQVSTTHFTKPLVSGQVNDVVVRIKITGTTASAMTCWIDSVQVANSTGLTIGGPDPFNYPKVGIYRGWQGDGFPPLAVQVANVEHGTASLLSRVTNPPLWPAVV
jgi:polysaccharide lyase-like protein